MKPQKQETQTIITRRPNGTKRVSFKCLTPSKTDQTFKDECDTYTILDRFMKTGELTHLNKREAHYSDVSDVPSLLEAHEIIEKAHEAFNELPSEIRKKLDNNPLNLEEYLKDKNNHEEAIKYGLLELKEESLKDVLKEALATPNDQTNDSTKPSKE